MLFSKIIVFILLLFFTKSTNGSDTYCDGTGWEQYRDEKCYKLIQDFASRDKAKTMCEQEWLPQSDASTPQLVSIKSVKEQNFLTDYVFNKSAVEFNVWISARRTSEDANKFVWDDDSVLEFTNWAEDSPSQEARKGCVVMESMLMRKLKSGIDGKWRDLPCGSQNYVICEKLQRWSFSKLQQSFLASRKRLDETENQLKSTQSELCATKSDLSDTKNQLLTTKSQLTNTQSELNTTQKDLILTKSRLNEAESKIQDSIKNPVPIGFIYVQLSNQPEPSFLWSAVQWKDVTTEYAGLFFRAVGGDAAQFGTVQSDNSPRVTIVRIEWYSASEGVGKWDNTTLYPGGKSSGIGVFTGNYDGKYGFTHQFYQSGGEVRPRNTAMRIWKRTG